VTVHFQDESRFGRMTQMGKRVVKKGVEPIGLMDTCRENFYVYGSIEPLNGTYLMSEKDKMSSENFQEFLDDFGAIYTDGLHVMVCDGASTHWAKDLRLPENLILLKLPPYCPELNPIERLWQDLKKELKNKTWNNIQSLKSKVFSLLDKLTFDKIYTLAAWDWVINPILDG